MLLPWVLTIFDKWAVPEHHLLCPVCGKAYDRVEAVEDAFLLYIHGDPPSGERATCSVAVETGLPTKRLA